MTDAPDPDPDPDPTPAEFPAPAQGDSGDPRPGRPRRRRARRRAGDGRGRPGWPELVAAVVATALLTSVSTAWAGHQFGDVPDAHPFHDEIDWLVDTGIANGYPDDTFKPASPVSRQAMAAFLARFYDQQAGLMVASTSGTDTSASRPDGWKTIAGHTTTTVQVPPGTTARIVTTVSLAHSCESGRNGGIWIAGAPYCQLRLRIDGTNAAPGEVTIAYSDLTDAQIAGGDDLLIQPQGTSFTFVSPVVGPGPHTVVAQVRALSDATGEPHPGVGVFDSSIVSEVMLLDRP